ncbi:hypothetical protein [Corynebacterium freiburgense]|uniref:hypothetical protein n=1 Tax=Corynebacterium freiburgense TaxID=556548 RepID=UPI0012EB713D|nr:hypothetical protein [Corynebacterium freiburgense]WJZ03075.1 hypothetical protein CFREI_08985 [Corynebacterium freiburgense]
MSINNMLESLNSLNSNLEGQSNNLMACAQSIHSHMSTLMALDGGTSNSSTRQALSLLDQATRSCQKASMAISEAKSSAVHYISEVRS